MAKLNILFVFIVGCGGFIGSILRYVLSFCLQNYSKAFPFGTFGSNICGCFIIGILGEFITRKNFLSQELWLFFATGLCGGFTTMSSMIYELTKYLENGKIINAGVYLFSSLICSFASFYLGNLLARRVFI